MTPRSDAPWISLKGIVFVALGCAGFVAAFQLLGKVLTPEPGRAAPSSFSRSAERNGGKPESAPAGPSTGAASPLTPIDGATVPDGPAGATDRGRGARDGSRRSGSAYDLSGGGGAAPSDDLRSPGSEEESASERASGAGGAPSGSATDGRLPRKPGESVAPAEGTGGEIIPTAPGAGTAAPPPTQPSGDGSKDEDADATTDADPDHSEPALASLTFNPEEVAAGGTTTLTIVLTGELIGETRIGGTLTSPSGAASLPFTSINASGGSFFSVGITISQKAEAGRWYVSYLTILNQASYSLTHSFASGTVPPGGSVQVVSSESDSAPPVVRDITLEKPTVRDIERNLIRIEISDEGSGVASVTGAFENHSKSALIWFTAAPNTSTGIWEGPVIIPAQAECGEWTLQQIRATDKANNLAYLTADNPLVARTTFALLRDDECDYGPPNLETFDISPRIVSAETGAVILISARVQDDRSGVMKVFGWAAPVSATGQETKINFNCSQDPTDPQLWLGRIEIPRFAQKATWKVGLVHVEDKARNGRDYRPNDAVIAEAGFTIE